MCFQFLFVSDRHATSTSIRDMLSFISSRVNTSLDISSLPTSWNMRRNVLREDAVCEFIDGWEEVKVRLSFLFR